MHRVVTPEERTSIRRMLALPLRRKVQLAWGLRHDAQVTNVMKLPLALVIGYILLPVHVVPRWIPFFRRLDNLLVAAIGLWLFVKLVPPDLLEQHLAQVEKHQPARPSYR
ncbi:MAG: YkvA family protein [Dehalococcoidia bacterium]